MKIHIVSPPYHSASGGIKVLHYLGYLAHTLGHKVDMRSTILNPEWGNYHETVDVPDITIHPEINPATKPEDGNIVRWVLYFPGRLSGPTLYPEHELVYSILDDYLEEAQKACPHRPVSVFFLPFMTLPGIDEPVERTNMTCFWEGKGSRAGAPPETQVNEITRGWPSPRSELIKLFKKCKTLYTCDIYTAINVEAELCGCEVLYWNGTEYEPVKKMKTKIEAANTARDLNKVDIFLNEVANHFRIKV